MTGSALPPCRRCTECEGEAHHWMEGPLCESWTPEDGPIWGCKHCDYRCADAECESCGEDGPVDIATVIAPALYLCPSCVGDAA